MELEDFFIGRYEVTNREYKDFIDAGGYSRQEFWTEEFIKDGAAVTWEESMRMFTDRSGRPGPSTWEGGRYPEGQDNYPVSGISWYEAAAYAKFRGRELPTYYHWSRAFSEAVYPVALPVSNLESEGPVAVGRSGSIGWTGTYDLVGNVREWCFNSVGDRKAVLGGGWSDANHVPFATVLDAESLPPFDRSPTNGVRLAMTIDAPDSAQAVREPIPGREPFIADEPVPDNVFAAYRSAFDYDATPLNSAVEETVVTDEWIYERVSFDTTYNDERILLHLFLPQNAPSPFQTIIHWAGIGALLRAEPNIEDPWWLFLVRNGRAVAFPEVQGTYAKRWRLYPDWSTIAGRDLTIEQVIDLRRTIDYLETRPDIRRDKIGYHGTSWGGRLGGIALAVEPRLRVAVLNQAGIEENVRTEIDVTHYLERVSQPVLQFNGRYDSDFRFDTEAKPFFDLLGTPEIDKKHVVEPTGHYVPMHIAVGETLNWYDKYLGVPTS